MKLIEATFIGKDRELKTGERYVIELMAGSNCVNIRINNKGRKYICPYQSITAFLNNWDEIKHI